MLDPVGPGLASQAVDSVFKIIGDVDSTKSLNFQVDTQATASQLTLDVGAQTTSRVLSAPVLTGAATLAVLSETQTFSGAKTFSAITTISNATTSSSTTTGALVVAGGLGVGGTMVIGGNLTSQAVAGAVQGFEVQGTTGGFVAGKLYAGASLGLILASKTGSANDFTLTDPSGNIVASVPTGTKDMSFAAQVIIDGATTKTLRVTNPTANAAVAVTFGGVGPTGSTAGNAQGWLRISVAGTDRYIPFW